MEGKKEIRDKTERFQSKNYQIKSSESVQVVF